MLFCRNVLERECVGSFCSRVVIVHRAVESEHVFGEFENTACLLNIIIEERHLHIDDGGVCLVQ